MGEHEKQEPKPRPALINNWISLAGTILTAISVFTVACLIAFDSLSGFSNPYMGILTYLIVPGFIWIGLALIAIGKWYAGKIPAGTRPFPIIDLNKPRHRRNVAISFILGFLFLLASAFGSYRGHHVTESVQFCGLLCHSVMKPQHTAYQNSPHAKVRCTECHIGPGATWLVRSKISGAYQAYATLANTYPRPVPTPVQNLRPAQETCELCHWPEKFHGAVDLYHRHYMADEANTPWTIRMLLKVGGGSPKRGPVGGIHWHMAVANRIEYIPSDDSRQNIPWVRMTNQRTGREVVFESKANPLTEEQKKRPLRRLDCIDCHNRPTHIFNSPNEALDTALWLNQIDASIPSVKLNAANALVASTETETEAQGYDLIAARLSKDYENYGNQEAVKKAIAETQNIFLNNIFPEMKTSWKVRPDNIGHHVWPGCFRCHNGEHVSAGGETITRNCNACHTIVAQGFEPNISTKLEGLEFDHPGGEVPQEMICSDCHTGAP
jgi:hypothetical protein